MGKLDGMIYTIICIVVVALAIVVVLRVSKMIAQARRDKMSVNNQQSSYVQLNAAAKQAEATTASSSDYKTVKGFLAKLDEERQNRYMPGRNSYEMARTNGNLRSIIYRDANAIQKLLDEMAGTGEFIGPNKEIVKFNQAIGQYVDVDGYSKRETKVGIIHYTAEGAYIVPARPN